MRRWVDRTCVQLSGCRTDLQGEGGEEGGRTGTVSSVMLSTSMEAAVPQTFSKRSSRIRTVSSHTSLLFFCRSRAAGISVSSLDRVPITQKQKPKAPRYPSRHEAAPRPCPAPRLPPEQRRVGSTYGLAPAWGWATCDRVVHAARREKLKSKEADAPLRTPGRRASAGASTRRPRTRPGWARMRAGSCMGPWVSGSAPARR